MPAVYATAKPGVRTRIASAAAGRARDRRHRWLLEICERSPGLRVVDIGCGPLGLRAWAPDLDVTGVDVRPQPAYPGPFVCADATRPLPFVAGEWEEIALMRQSDLLGLFGPPVIAERVGPAVKSWIAVRIPPSPARRGAERPAAVAHGPGAG